MIPAARARAALALVLAVAVVGGWICTRAAPAAGAPVVEIRSHAKLEITAVRRRGDELWISGRLFDPATLLGLPRSDVELTVAGVAVRETTDADGRFTAQVPAAGGLDAAAVRAEFSGGDALDGATLEELVNPTLAPVTLTLHAQPTPAGVELLVEAESDGEALSLPVTLLADREGEQAIAPVGQTVAGQPLRLTRKQLGGAGLRRFRADFAGDAAHQPASATASYELTSASQTTLALSTKTLAYEDTVTASGAVTDEDGLPLADASVTLMAGDRRLAEGVTDAKGGFRFRIEGEILGVGPRTLQALTAPGGAVQSSRSAPAMVTVSAPAPVPVLYTVLAFIATVVAAGAFFAGRSKPWRRLAKAAPPAQQAASSAEAQQGGLVVARPSLVSSLRRANDHGLGGVVRDTVRGRPVAGAHVLLRRTAADPGETIAERRAECGEDGTFAVEDLSAGEWTVEVSASAHLTERFQVTLPHRGELRGVRVDLVPVREKVFLLYQRAAMPVLPDAKLWGVWSPRQIVDHVRASRPSPALASLTDLVEEVYFSARPAHEDVVPSARERVEAAVAERAAAGPPLPPAPTAPAKASRAAR